jgi:hypothetical protein
MKIVKEHIYESFKQGDDKLSSLGLGKKYLIEKWLAEFNIKDYYINRDFSIDAYGEVILAYRELTELPSYIQFNKIDRKTSSQQVGFSVAHTKLSSLRGCPKEVMGTFDCSNNNLKSLKFGPEYVWGTYFCEHNQIETLEGCPKYIGRNFHAEHNKLTTLEYGPVSVGGSYFCYDNSLITLKGSPLIIPGDFNCKNNINLDSLEGAPKEIHGELVIELTKLSELSDKEIRNQIKITRKYTHENHK